MLLLLLLPTQIFSEEGKRASCCSHKTSTAFRKAGKSSGQPPSCQERSGLQVAPTAQRTGMLAPVNAMGQSWLCLTCGIRLSDEV